MLELFLASKLPSSSWTYFLGVEKTWNRAAFSVSFFYSGEATTIPSTNYYSSAFSSTLGLSLSKSKFCTCSGFEGLIVFYETFFYGLEICITGPISNKSILSVGLGAFLTSFFFSGVAFTF